MSERPEEVLLRMSEGADPRRRRSLQIVHDVCQEQHTRGSADYSLGVLGALCQAKGGPAERALRNPSGAPYRALIAAHAALNGRPKAGKASKAEADGLLDGVGDPMQRARIEGLRDEVKSLRRQLQIAQEVANRSAVITLTGSPQGDAHLPDAAFGRRASVDLLQIEREALGAALDAERLRRLGIAIDARGRVRLPDGREIFPVGFATALTKIAEAFGAPGVGTFERLGPERGDSLH